MNPHVNCTQCHITWVSQINGWFKPLTRRMVSILNNSGEKRKIMTDNPCDSCREDCFGGIIYGNCELFRSWCRDHKYIGSGRLFAQKGVQCQSVDHDRTNARAVGIK